MDVADQATFKYAKLIATLQIFFLNWRPNVYKLTHLKQTANVLAEAEQYTFFMQIK